MSTVKNQLGEKAATIAAAAGYYMMPAMDLAS
jgi:hypothetical protein